MAYLQCPKCSRFGKALVDKQKLQGGYEGGYYQYLSYCQKCKIYYRHTGMSVLEEWGEVCYHGGNEEITKERFEKYANDWAFAVNMSMPIQHKQKPSGGA